MLIQILADFINQAPTEPFGGKRSQAQACRDENEERHDSLGSGREECEVAWDELVRLATMHQVGGIVYYQCKGFMPDEVRAAFGRTYASQAFHFANRERAVGLELSALRDAGIPCVQFKGMTLAALYPVPALRSMGDTDVLVRPEDRERAGQALERVGFSCEDRGVAEWHYSYGDLDFELHAHLLYDDPANSTGELAFCETLWGYVDGEGRLDWSFHFVYLLLHLKKHLVHKGVGLRQFVDVELVRRTCDLDWGWIGERLAELGLMPFWRRCEKMLDQWFNGAPQGGAEDAAATEWILSCGVFGLDNEDNGSNAAIKEMMDARGASRLASRARVFTRSFFPSYESVRTRPQYSYVDGRPYLMPAMYAHRLLRAIRDRKFKIARGVVRSATVSDAAIERRREQLAYWGL